MGVPADGALGSWHQWPHVAVARGCCCCSPCSPCSPRCFPFRIAFPGGNGVPQHSKGSILEEKVPTLTSPQGVISVGKSQGCSSSATQNKGSFQNTRIFQGRRLPGQPSSALSMLPFPPSWLWGTELLLCCSWHVPGMANALHSPGQQDQPAQAGGV